MTRRGTHKHEGRHDRSPRWSSLWIEAIASAAFLVAVVAMLIILLAMGV